MRIVLDNSVTVGWVYPEQATPYSTGLLDDLADYAPMAPALWRLEFSNAMLLLYRRRKLSEEQRQSSLARAESWKVDIDPQLPHMAAISALAIAHGLTTYDAAYLDCALRHAAPLATQDAVLKKAARALDCWYDVGGTGSGDTG